MIEQFRTYLTNEKRYSPLTVRNYIGDIEQFRQALDLPEDCDYKNITRTDIRQWLMSLNEYCNQRGQSLSKASINRRMSSIKSFFGWLLRKNHIDKNPTIGIHRLKCSSRLPSFISEEQIVPGIEALRDGHSTRAQHEDTTADFIAIRNHLIITLLYGLGLRRAELVGINRDDLGLDNTTLKVRGKGNKERVVPILRYISECIFEYQAEILRSKICIKDEKALILSLKGERLSATSIYNIVRNELARMGVKGKLSPHVLRHTFATHLMNRGSDMRILQELMGHASLRSTQVYTHNTISAMRAAYDKAHPRGAKKELNKTGPEGRAE